MQLNFSQLSSFPHSSGGEIGPEGGGGSSTPRCARSPITPRTPRDLSSAMPPPTSLPETSSRAVLAKSPSRVHAMFTNAIAERRSSPKRSSQPLISKSDSCLNRASLLHPPTTGSAVVAASRQLPSPERPFRTAQSDSSLPLPSHSSPLASWWHKADAEPKGDKPMKMHKHLKENFQELSFALQCTPAFFARIKKLLAYPSDYIHTISTEKARSIVHTWLLGLSSEQLQQFYWPTLMPMFLLLRQKLAEGTSAFPCAKNGAYISSYIEELSSVINAPERCVSTLAGQSLALQQLVVYVLGKHASLLPCCEKFSLNTLHGVLLEQAEDFQRLLTATAPLPPQIFQWSGDTTTTSINRLECLRSLMPEQQIHPEALTIVDEAAKVHFDIHESGFGSQLALVAAKKYARQRCLLLHFMHGLRCAGFMRYSDMHICDDVHQLLLTMDSPSPVSDFTCGSLLEQVLYIGSHSFFARVDMAFRQEKLAHLGDNPFVCLCAKAENRRYCYRVWPDRLEVIHEGYYYYLYPKLPTGVGTELRADKEQVLARYPITLRVWLPRGAGQKSDNRRDDEQQELAGAIGCTASSAAAAINASAIVLQAELQLFPSDLHTADAQLALLAPSWQQRCAAPLVENSRS